MKLYKHQEDALQRTKTFNKCAFYHDMGLGKTFTGSEKLVSFGTNGLIVCQKSKVNDWLNHFNEHYKRLQVFTVDLTKKNSIDNFIHFCNTVEYRVFGVINYDLIFRRPELLKLTNFSLLLDESSMIQNDRAKRTKAILKLKASNVILLSGTPVGGKYENLYSQLKLLGWKITKKEFWANYIDYELVQYSAFSPMIPKIKGYKNIDELKKMLKFYGADFLKSDEVFDLPAQNFNIVKVPIGKEYKEFKKEKYICINNKEFIGDTPLKTMLYARMMCSTYNKYKLDAFVDLIDSTYDRVIVFYNFTDELETMKALICKRAYSVVNGAERDLDAYENKSNSITFVQYQAGAMGLNLQKANKIVYYSLPLSSELYEQSKKRIHRIGQNRPCFYYLLLAENSIEERIKTTLDKRNDYTQELFKEDF